MMKKIQSMKLSFPTNKNLIIVIIATFLIFNFLNLYYSNDYENLSGYINSKFSYKTFRTFDHIDDLHTDKDVVWHIYQKEDSMLQVAELDDKVIGLYVKAKSLRSKTLPQSAVFNKETATMLYDDRIEISYLEKNTQEVNSILILSNEIENYIDILFSDEAIYSMQMIYLINYERGLRELFPLNKSPELHLVAKDYSETMSRSSHFSHTNQEGISPLERVESYGYKFKLVGENLVKGQEMDPFHAHNKLINSPGHMKNILNPQYSFLNIGTSKSENQIYVCQLFVDSITERLK